MLRLMQERIRAHGHPGQLLLFIVALGPGWFLPFVFHLIIGAFFLPVPVALQNTMQEALIVRNIFVASGFTAVFLAALGTVLFLVQNRASSIWWSVCCAGLAVGALGQMLWLSPGGWAFIMR